MNKKCFIVLTIMALIMVSTPMVYAQPTWDLTFYDPVTRNTVRINFDGLFQWNSLPVMYANVERRGNAIRLTYQDGRYMFIAGIQIPNHCIALFKNEHTEIVKV